MSLTGVSFGIVSDGSVSDGYMNGITVRVTAELSSGPCGVEWGQAGRQGTVIFSHTNVPKLR